MIQDRINERSPWQDITEGNKIYEPATSREFNTGEWRTATPIFDKEKCRQCLLCAPVCPDCSIPVTNGVREKSLIMITARAAVSVLRSAPSELLQ